MEEIAKFWEKINLMAKDQQKTILAGTVVAVDEAERTCTLKVGNVQYEDVRLYGVVSAARKGFCFIPKAGSYLLAGRIEGSNELFALMFSEIDKVLLTIGEKVAFSADAEQVSYQNDKINLTITGTKAELTADEIVFNGGSFGGLVQIADITAKLNALVKTFNSHTHSNVVVQVVGQATGTMGPSGKPDQSADTFSQSDYENEKIKH